MLQTILHGLRTIALLSALASRACSRTLNEENVMSAVLVSYGIDFRVTEVLRPRLGRGEVVLVRIAASGVNPPDTRIFDGAAALGTTSDGQRRVSRPGFNFNHGNEGNDYPT